MKHRPFEKALAELLTNGMTSLTNEEKMVTAAETKAKKNRSTKAEVKKGVGAARKYLRQHPHATMKDLIAYTGLSGPTLSRHLTKVGKKKAAKKASKVLHTGKDLVNLVDQYTMAKAAAEEAKAALIDYIQTQGL